MINTNYLIDLFKQNFGDNKVKFLNLKPGQLISGQVIELIDNQALVSIMGTKVLAKTEVPLNKGQSSMFMVTSTANELKLRLLDDKGLPLTKSSIKSIIEHLNIKNTKLNQSIISFMIEENIPIEKSVVESISLAFNKNTEIDELLTAVKLLHDKGLKLSNENIRHTIEFYQNDGLSGKLISLNKSIEQQLKQNINLPVEIIKLLENTNNKINNLLKDFNLFRTSTPIHPITNEQAQLVSTEANAKALVINNELNSRAQVVNKEIGAQLANNVDFASNSKELNKILLNENRNIDTIARQQINQNNENNSRIIFSDEINIQQKVSSKDILASIIKYLEEIQLKPDKRTQGISLKENIEQLYIKRDIFPQNLVRGLEKTLQHLNGQNLLLQNDSPNFSQAIIQFPGYSPYMEKPIYLQLHTKKDDSNKIDKNDMQLAFLFQLDTLGDTVIKLHIVHDQLFMQIINNNPIMKDIIKLLEPDFLRFIKDSGYKTSGITMKNLEESSPKKMAGSSSSYQGVDFRI